MILILLLITMISCVCGTSFLKVKQTHYQAEENDNITLEWMFTTRSDKSPNLLFIICNLITDLRVSVLYRLHNGVEVPESQDEQFSGRVQWDRDVLREGRLRLHVSRLRTEDSGRYKCVVRTGSDLSADQCWLNVTASVAQEQHTTPTVNPEPLRQERFYVFIGALVLTAGIILVGTAAAAGRKVAKVVITVIVVIAAVVVIVIVYSIAVETETAPEANVLEWLFGGFTLLAVFLALLTPYLSTCSQER
ncbi:uncharacterized protein LOC128429901 [Pleuronectes platessa]|uniref:uncharacterized protein LOC128429900 n=1 Tax=Pleuronectes platessa TaxID=8262 RepID=UPI00232A31F2|nr:uncharacterized protein LOC128429900 [Pleuronectes platessa]XP_053271745.1 uncharacterized protein LOC128429901 [Pleuronectes platessa]XP_053271746.1 uncharacterized protein LOC128429901 [Pleuronectes platessa]XP_053271747.1 uncharacterized protein LOC128429901 [Pleuronectes platessa]XP_053271749.1 uncharacterized protein LOC128429901 [Pleuronectes platessa]